MDRLAEYLNPEQAAAHLRRRDDPDAAEFVAVRNLEYVFSPETIYPLAPRVTPPLEKIVAFAVDMDGTSTTTEPLALHALEYMVRRFTGRMTVDAWHGLDPVADHPFVIGNSNVRHVEFLLDRYRAALDRAALCRAFFEAVCWTLACMDDPPRRRAVIHAARQCGVGALVEDEEFFALTRSGAIDDGNVAVRVVPFIERHGNQFECTHAGPLAAAALDIYYMRYHSILRAIEAGRGSTLSRELLGDSARRLIEPMPGYDLFVPLVKGWIEPEHDALFAWLASQAEYAVFDTAFPSKENIEKGTVAERLARLARHFCVQPAKLALVTASIRYEADATMQEVLKIVGERVRQWPLPADAREKIAARVSDPASVFDGFICAADACEHRLKPHPDLYSLALQQMLIPKEDYRCCVGLEDTEPGIIALRAAGVGCAVALPNHDTHRQDYRAASLILRGGLPELIVRHNLLLAALTDRS